MWGRCRFDVSVAGPWESHLLTGPREAPCRGPGLPRAQGGGLAAETQADGTLGEAPAASAQTYTSGRLCPCIAIGSHTQEESGGHFTRGASHTAPLCNSMGVLVSTPV